MTSQSRGVDAEAFFKLQALVADSGVAYVIHEHAPVRTMEDAKSLNFDLGRIVKTVVFLRRDQGLVLAALPGPFRVDYAKLTALSGIPRRDLSPLSPPQVLELVGLEPGAVSPLASGQGRDVFLDESAFEAGSTVYCGIGRLDRTLEIAPADLARISGARTGRFSR